MMKLWFWQAFSAAVIWGFGYAMTEKVMTENTLSPAFILFATACLTLPTYIGVSYLSGNLKMEMEQVFIKQSASLSNIIDRIGCGAGEYTDFIQCGGQECVDDGDD